MKRWMTRRATGVVAAARRLLGLKPRIPADRAAQNRKLPIGHFDVDPKTMRIRRRG